MDWISLAVSQTQWILWLNGAAGAGKSAIGRSIVDLCLQQDTHIIRFFFFRTDPTRNTVASLVATLVHQLWQCIPALAEIIIAKIASDPLVFTKSLKTQFEYLIFGPLRQLHSQSLFQQTLVFLFDGLDECDSPMDQEVLIHIMSSFVGTTVYPVLAFFGSRSESHISAIFRSPDISHIVRSLTLDNHYLPDEDIYLFLNDSFSTIRKTHQFGHLLDSNWPPTTNVQTIMNKSSGQFIYASVVVRFVGMPDMYPAKQLDIVCGLRPSGRSTPFAQLDTLYQYIFSCVRDVEFTSLVLATMLLTSMNPPSLCALFLDVDESEIHVALAALASVVSYNPQEKIFEFLHASLEDFLFDSERSHGFYIDPVAWYIRLTILAFQGLEKGVDLEFCLHICHRISRIIY